MREFLQAAGEFSLAAGIVVTGADMSLGAGIMWSAVLVLLLCHPRVWRDREQAWSEGDD